MLAYFCKPCLMFYRLEELLPGKRCPQCKAPAAPRLVLAGQVIGKENPPC